MEIKWILIGEVVATQGNKGEIRVIPHTDFPDRFATMEEIVLFKPGSNNPELKFKLEKARLHKSFVILKLEGVDNITEAEKIRGMEIKVGTDQVVPLPEGQNYIFELLGLKVYTTDQLFLGVITEVLKTGANDVYIVKPEPGITKLKEILIPVIDEVVLDIDLEKQTILVNLLDGLLE